MFKACGFWDGLTSEDLAKKTHSCLRSNRGKPPDGSPKGPQHKEAIWDIEDIVGGPAPQTDRPQ